MKMLSLIAAMVLAAPVFATSARAEEPLNPSALKLTPQMQAMLAELLKAADAEPARETPPAAPPPPTTEKPIVPAPPSPLGSTSLKTGGLTTSALGGHGTVGGFVRLTKEAWRELFPVRK